MGYVSPRHIHRWQRQHFNINRSQVQYFSVLGKKSYSDVQCLRCVLPLPCVLQRLLLLLFLGVRWDQQQLWVKLRSIKTFLWFMFIFHSFFTSPIQTGKPRNFSCHTSHLSIYRRYGIWMMLHFHLCTKILSVEFIHATTGRKMFLL